MCVWTASAPSAVGRRARSAADRFVVAERRVAEQQVVHRPLAGRRQAERAEQHIDHALRRFDIAADHRRRNLRPRRPARADSAGTRGSDDLDRREHALVERNVFGDQAAQHVHHGRGDDRAVGVQVARA